MYSAKLFFPRLVVVLFCSLILSGCAMFNRPDRGGPTPDTAHKVVRTAYAQMGTKYRYGGASPRKGFDCSGLIWWTYRQHGINIPRIARKQAKSGHKVAVRNVRLGDIVVFRTGWSPRSLHTGIYAGGNSFIHSPSSGKRVRLSSMKAPYWRKRLVSVRRVLP
jgi:cell wall-associated NlpC family hydrolase